MTRKELEKMVSLAGDCYINELYSDKLYGRKKLSPAKFISAAAVFALIVGAGAAALAIGNSGNIGNSVPDIPPITSVLQTELTDYSSNAERPTQAKETEMQEYPEETDPAIYFQIDRFDAVIDYTLELGGEKYYIDGEYAAETLPFDTSLFIDTREAEIYCDTTGRYVNAHIYLDYIHFNSRDLSADIIISDDGALFPDYWTDPDSLLESAPERNGVKIAGYTLSEKILDFRSVGAIFRVGGTGYTVKLRGVTYAQALEIIDSIIENPVHAGDFDATYGAENILKEYVTAVRLGHKTDCMGGVSITDNSVVRLSFSLPDEWEYDGAERAYCNGEEVFSHGYAWYADEGYSVDPEEEMRGLLFEEDYGTDGLYEYRRHISVRYYGGAESRSYEYILKRGDWYIYVSFSDNGYIDEERMNKVIASLEISAFEKFYRPVPDNIPISEPYSRVTETIHNGVNFAAPEGSEVCAAADGTVASGESENGAYGINVIIDHGNGVSTLYAHLSEVKVRAGDRVKKGDVIALSGKTGATKGDTLHFEVRVGGHCTDPGYFIGD